MKKITLALVCLSLLGLNALGQSTRTTRPRVAPTPTRETPTLKNDVPGDSTDRRPPVLTGNTDDRSNPQRSGSSAPAVEDENGIVRVETNLVTMPVSVLDRDGRFIGGLQQKDFRIFENGVEQKVDYFQSVEQPFTVVLMIDISPSTAFQIDEIHDGAIAFVNQLRPADKVMVIAFDDNVHVLCRPTNDRRALREAIFQAEFGNGTGFYDAIDHVINRELPNITGRKAVVIFTDGVDTSSRRTNYQSTIADAEEVDALFYPIRYGTEQNFDGSGGGGGGAGSGDDDDDTAETWVDLILGKPRQQQQQQQQRRRYPRNRPAGTSPEEYATGLRYLEELAQKSGGRKFEANSISNLEAAFSGIAEELRRQYSLGYYPDKAGQVGERRRISVRVMRPSVVVKAKNTYIFGQGEKRIAGS